MPEVTHVHWTIILFDIVRETLTLKIMQRVFQIKVMFA